MVLDTSKPAGTDLISQGDDVIREHATAVQAALNLEHEMVDADGLQQSGVHMFVIDTYANLLAGSWKQGSICYATDQSPNKLVAYIYNSGALWPVSTLSLDGGATGNVITPYLDDDQQWTKMQRSDWKIVAGGATFQHDVTADPAFIRINLDQNILIDNPTNEVAGSGYTVVYDIAQDIAAGKTVSFGTLYRAANGLVPIAQGASERTLLTVVKMQDGFYQVSSTANFLQVIT